MNTIIDNTTTQIRNLLTRKGNLFLLILIFVNYALAPSVHGNPTPQDTATKHRFIILKTDLTTEILDISNVDHASVTGSTISNGITRTIPVSDIIMLYAKQPQPIDQNTLGKYITTTNGQRILGRLLVSDSPDETIRWQNDYFGEFIFPIEQVYNLHLANAITPKRDNPLSNNPNTAHIPDNMSRYVWRLRHSYTTPHISTHYIYDNRNDDLILFANKDRLSGYVASIGLEAVTIETDDGNAYTFQYIQVDDIYFANPHISPLNSQSRLWTNGGDIIDISPISLLTNDNAIQVNVYNHPAAWFSLSFIRGIAFAPNQLQPLATLIPQTVAPEGFWFHTMDPPVIHQLTNPLGLESMTIQGPSVVTYNLPGNATKFATTCTIANPIATDLEIAFFVDDAIVCQTHINNTNQREYISFDLPDDAHTMTIRIRSGKYGPILNAVTLDTPRFHIAQ